ncbi:MAG: DUF2442 domain-containing protein [Planctomycetaceae bacterium]
MTTLTLEEDPLAVKVDVTDDSLVVVLADGRTLSVPLPWYPRLLHGTKAERERFRLLGDGYAIEWTDLDEHIGIEGLVAGRRSGESRESFARWRASRTDETERELPGDD